MFTEMNPRRRRNVFCAPLYELEQQQGPLHFTLKPPIGQQVSGLTGIPLQGEPHILDSKKIRDATTCVYEQFRYNIHTYVYENTLFSWARTKLKTGPDYFQINTLW